LLGATISWSDDGGSLSLRLFGSRRFSRTIEHRIVNGWLGARRGRVLDLGAGTGELAGRLANAGYRVTALDLDVAALRTGRAAASSGVVWVAGDATRLPFADSAFECVICNSAIEHIPDDRATIRESARVTRAGGQIIVTTDSLPARSSWWLRWIPHRWRRSELRIDSDFDRALAASHQRRHRVVRFYDAQHLAALLDAGGFRVQDWRYYLNGPCSKAIFELHLVLAALDFYNRLSRRLYPLFVPFTFPVLRRSRGYGLAVSARRTE
jgi:demethylmenaquinone methyltransferase/2-methoxy-6-polyprenyl-1,4-benzoquinol methylase